jgi:hypothetical protein
MTDHAISRRAALGATTLGLAALGATPALAQANPGKTFVLVHGAWHGGWCWRRVADILERHGHKVYAQSLTGNGDRSHLLSKDVVLDTHIAPPNTRRLRSTRRWWSARRTRPGRPS